MLIRSFTVSIVNLTDEQWARASKAVVRAGAFSTSAWVVIGNKLQEIGVPGGFITSVDFLDREAVKRAVIERCGREGIVLTSDDVRVSEPSDHFAAA